MKSFKEFVKTIPLYPSLLTVPLLLAAIGCAIPITGTDNIMFGPAMAAYLGFVMIAVSHLFFKEISIPRSPVVFLAVGFLVWTVIALQWSQVPYVSAFFTLSISTLPIIFVVMLMQPNRDTVIPLHVAAIITAMAGAAIWALIQFFFMYEEMGPRIRHPMLNPNNLAAFFNLGLLPCIGMFLLAKEKLAKGLLYALVALFLMGMLVTQGKGAMLSFFISSIVLFGVYAWKHWPVQKEHLIKLGALFGLMAVCYLIVNMASGGFLSKSVTILGGIAETHTAHNRIDMWKAGFQMIKENPWTGIGLGAFYFFYPPFRSQTDNSDGFFVHNDPLQFWVEMGFMAPILFYGTLIAVLIRTIRALIVLPKGSAGAMHIMAPFCGMLAVLGHTHITFNLYMPPILITIACMLAYWYRATEIALQDEDKRFVMKFGSAGKRNLALSGFVICVLLMAVYPARVAWAIHYSKVVQVAANEGRHEDSRHGVEMIGKFAPDSFGRYYEFKSRLHISILVKNAARKDGPKMSLGQLRENYDKAMEYLDAAEERNPAFWQTKYLRAKLYQAVDDYLIVDGIEQAFEILKYNVNYNKLDIDSRMELARLLDRQGQTKDAWKVMHAGATWPRPKGQKDLEFLFLYASYFKKLGDEKNYNVLISEVQKRAKQYGIPITIN